MGFKIEDDLNTENSRGLPNYGINIYNLNKKGDNAGVSKYKEN
jgi:hypothetical protein